MINNKNMVNYVPILIFIFGFAFIPLQQLGMLSLMPGDIGDARLNNYFLENIYQFFFGKSDSLWNLSFFSPFPYVLGFSDNHFGSAPVYILARIANINTDTSFQFWFLCGYAFNFAACFYSLRRLNTSVVAASIGALIFTFALPTAAHAGHAQLHYRFGLPLSIVFFILFINTKNWRFLLVSAAWLVWQFYSGVYIGFFALLMLASVLITYIAHILLSKNISIRSTIFDYKNSWKSIAEKSRYVYFLLFIALFILMIILFYPYLQVSNLYGAKRSWDEISTMLPRPQSYFLADNSYIWSFSTAEIFSNIPMRHEHQMFIGLMPILLILFGFSLGAFRNNGLPLILLFGMMAILVISTLYISGFSLWYLVHDLPLFSAIRVVSRLDQAFLFPIAFLVAVSIDFLIKNFKNGLNYIFILIIPLLVAESALSGMGTSSKTSWQERTIKLNHELPDNLDKNSILFFSQHLGPPYADELDAMWVSLLNGNKTLNGYSGLYPPGFTYSYGKDCSEIPRRVLSYLNFIQQADNVDAYRQLMKQIVPIGFINCNDNFITTPPSLSFSNEIYTKEHFSQLDLRIESIIKLGQETLVTFNVINSSDYIFAAGSIKPIRISWRYINLNGVAMTGWDNRKGLTFDIPANGQLQMSISVDSLIMPSSSALEISIVQEGIFWGHDVGVLPAKVLFNKE